MRKFFVGVAAAVLATFVAAAPSAEAATARRHQVSHAVARHGRMYSTNWSGFAVPAKSGERITAVTGSWIVPAIRPAPPGQSSSWIGIGGYETTDLIQVGTSSNGIVDDTYAWFETLPDYETRILSGCARDPSCSLAAGDHMAASVTNNGGDTWTIMLANIGDGVHAKWYWGRVVTYRSTLSSAEWVFEAPQAGYVVAGLPLVAQTLPANAPHARFNGGTFTVNGTTRNLGPGMAQRIFMPTATPSTMSPTGHFRVCAYKLSCATP